jgi:hypothetical protein
MPGLTIAAGYGAGGSIVAPDVAARLGLPFLDRAISATVLAQLNEAERDDPEGSAASLRRSFGDRILSLLTPLAGGVLGAGTDASPAAHESSADEVAAFRERAEAPMRAAFVTGAVVLGRAGSAAFQHEPGVLRVRLFGPRDARIDQGALIEGIDQDTARNRQREVDKSQEHYVRRLYGVGVDDPALFHLQLDSTALSLDTCAGLIVVAYRSLTADH